MKKRLATLMSGGALWSFAVFLMFLLSRMSILSFMI